MKNKSWFLAFVALFLGWATLKQFDFEQLKFKSDVGFVNFFNSIFAAYWYFKPPKEN